jgi:opacity protein-like surface antigen
VSNQDVSRAGADAGEMSFDNGVMYGGSLGYVPNNTSLRFELEYTNSENDIDGASGIVAGPVAGSVTVNALMFNAFYDFTNQTIISPYLGAGFGMAELELESDTLGLTDAGSENQMAYQVMAGVSYEPKMLRNTALSLGYRYFSLFDEAEFGAGASQTAIDYSSHNLELGARFRF